MAHSAATRPEPVPAPVRIGDWRFLPAEASLERDGERRRLEHRASAVLELLVRRRGAPVASAELVDAVWGGRSVSPNSVAVVIADLRRALDDDARAPRHIETIPKRGYRLTADAGAPAPTAGPAARPKRTLLAIALVVPLAIAAILLVPRSRGPTPVAVSIGAFANETRDPRLAPLVDSSRALVATALGRLDNVRLVTAPVADGLRIDGRLILWDGHPALALSAEDPGRHDIVWTGMAGGPEAALPRQVPEQIRSFGASLQGRAMP